MVAPPRRGAISLELALVLPILLLFVGGAVEWGLVLSRELSLVQIARDAALAGARTERGADPAGVARARATEALGAAGFDVSTSTITVEPVTLACGGALEVGVVTDVDAMLHLVPLPSQLSAVTTARLEDQ